MTLNQKWEKTKVQFYFLGDILPTAKDTPRQSCGRPIWGASYLADHLKFIKILNGNYSTGFLTHYLSTLLRETQQNTHGSGPWVPWAVSLWDKRAGLSNIRILDPVEYSYFCRIILPQNTAKGIHICDIWGKDFFNANKLKEHPFPCRLKGCDEIKR